MSTRCLLGYKINTTKVKYCYCHFDGYPSGVGRILLDNYCHNDSQALKLCSLKGIRSLAPSLIETIENEYPDGQLCGEMSFDEWCGTNAFGADYVYTYYPWSGEWGVRPTFDYSLTWIGKEQEQETINDPLERF